MARVKNNIITGNLSGHLNKQIVYKCYPQGVFVTVYPDMSKVKPSILQLAEKSRFSKAVAYAKAIIADPVKKAELQAGLPPGRKAYHQAIRDFLIRGEKS